MKSLQKKKKESLAIVDKFCLLLKKKKKTLQNLFATVLTYIALATVAEDICNNFS